MEDIYIGQILELEDKNSVCLYLKEKPAMIISKKLLGNFHFGDFILCEIRKGKNGFRKLYTLKKNHVGEVVFEEGEPYILFYYKKGEAIKFPCKYFPNLYDGLKVRFKLERQEDEIKAVIFKILGEKEDASIDILDIAERDGIPTVFSKRSLKQASLIKDDKLSYELGRMDLRKEDIFTIDGTYSKDFDDAISLKEENGYYILDVHIADVSYYIKEGSPLDLEARRRGMTTYLLNYVFPMFPENISNGVCSLKEGFDRYTISCRMKISKEGMIEDVSCFPSIIHSNKRMTYEKVNDVFKREIVSGYGRYTDILGEMDVLANLLYKNRMLKGAIDFNRNEPVISLNHHGHVVSVDTRVRGKAEFLIQEFMLAANQSMAQLLHHQNLYYPHRVHGYPDMERMKSVCKKLETIGVSFNALLEAKDENRSFVLNQILEEYKNHPNYQIIAGMLIGCMRRAKYSLEDVGHFGLGLPRNVHFTSPIRRYPDLVLHRIIRKNYFHRNPQTASEIEELKDIVVNCTSAEGRINCCEEKVIHMKCQEYLEAHIGEVMEAVVKDCSEKGLLIELKNCIEKWILQEELENCEYQRKKFCYTFLNSDICYGLGTILKVKLVKKPCAEKVSFEIVEPSIQKTYYLDSSKKYF